MKIGHGRWKRSQSHHDQGGERIQVANSVDRDTSQSQPVSPSASESVNPEQPVIPSASQSVSPDIVHLLTRVPRSGPRSDPCQTPFGNVITHAHSVATGPSRSSDDAQSPPLSVPTEAIEFAKRMPDLLKDVDSLATPQIIYKIHEALQELKKAKGNDYWLSPKGLEELKMMSEDQSRKGLIIFDYAPSTNASLCPMTAPEDE